MSAFRSLLSLQRPRLLSLVVRRAAVVPVVLSRRGVEDPRRTRLARGRPQPTDTGTGIMSNFAGPLVGVLVPLVLLLLLLIGWGKRYYETLVFCDYPHEIARRVIDVAVGR